ncbi:MAG: hypothetical protein KDD35_01605, partial [Bdellovibrionales bacterium]|nr:hypothetical protein [Bdellovibrionales bacterium]
PGIGIWNTNPPNRADALNPDVDPSQWWSGSIDGRGAKLPAPFAYYPHRAAYVDPETGEVSEIVVVPMDDVLGYMDGFGPINLNLVQDNIAPFALSLRGPPLVVLGHDGDNAWGGGYSYYMESVPNTSRQAHSLGYSMTTVDQYLADFPVPKGDRVHVEDGGWVNPESDWGDPQFVKWLYPPARSSRHPEFNQHDPRTYIDIEEGFSTTWRSWAVIVAGANLCESLEQMFKGRPLDISQIRAPRSDSTAVERCWHFYLSGLDSGFMYYGDSLDDEVKQSLGLSEAYREVKSSLDLKKDKTPPSLLPPQRWPYNPGGKAWGVTTRYKAVGFNGKPPNERDFYVWTLAFDLSGMDRVYLHWRTSEKSEYSLSNLDQETYQGGPGLSSWQTLPMNSRNIDPMFRGDPPSPQLDYFIQPPLIAHHYWVKIQGLKRVMVDYYIEAFDKMGNRVRSGIEHVWVD